MRFLAQYVRERNLVPMEQAIHRMTGMAAAVVGARDRGRVADGLAADLVLFDPTTVADRATYDEPTLLATGSSGCSSTAGRASPVASSWHATSDRCFADPHNERQGSRPRCRHAAAAHASHPRHGGCGAPRGAMAPTGGPGGQQGLYRLKPASQRLVEPLADVLVARRVSPDVLSLVSIVVAGIGGASLALSPSVPALLLVVPVAAAIRLVLNLLDGMVARRLGPGRPVGELWNEVGDRIADLLFVGGLAFVPAVGPWLGLSAVLAALLASYAGITARAAGGRRQYGGVMSKPGRMIVLALAAPAAFVTGDPRWLVGAAVVLIVGSLLTLAQRLRTAVIELRGAPRAG